MKEEKMMILSMLEEGKISSEEAVELLDALEASEEFNYEDLINDGDDDLINKEKARKLIDDLERNLKKQGKKMEGFGIELGNKLSGFLSGIKEKSGSINDYKTINTSLERDISNLINPTIDFKSTNGSIIAKTWDRDGILINIHCRYKDGLIDEDHSFYDFYEEENRLYFKPEYTSDIMINLEVYLPSKAYREIHLKTSNGKIEIDNLLASKVKCQTTNASISAEDIESKEINLLTKNGRVNLKDSEAPIIKAQTTNSHISVEDIESKALKLCTGNGGIKIYETSSDSILAKTSNGSIEFKNLNSKSIEFLTSNGKILGKDINLESIEIFKLETSNANIETEFGETLRNGYFDLQTSLGNIDLELPNLVYRVNNQVELGTRKIIAHNLDFKEGEDHFTYTASTSNASIRIY